MTMQKQQSRPGPGEGQGISQAVEMSSLVGAWRLTIAPVQGTPTPALITIHADGTLTTASLPVEPFLGAADRVIFVSALHGLWEPSAADTVRFKLVGLAATERGVQAAAATIRGSVGQSADGRTLVGSYDATVADPSGAKLATEHGALSAMRITLEDPGMPAW